MRGFLRLDAPGYFSSEDGNPSVMPDNFALHIIQEGSDVVEEKITRLQAVQGLYLPQNMNGI